MAKRPARNNLVLVLCAVGAGGLLGIVGWRLLGIAAERIWMGPAVFDEIPFNRAKWLSHESDKDPSIRKRMYHDLRAHHLKPGMTRASVLHLLGKPTLADGNWLRYYLGPDSLNMDTNELVVEFDSRARLVRVSWSDS